MKIATRIATEDWSRIIKGLIETGWHITEQYDNFDKGIDFDFLILKKERNRILFGWSNWEEGEIKCSEELMRFLENTFSVKFKFGEPCNLKPSVIALTRVQIAANKLFR